MPTSALHGGAEFDQQQTFAFFMTLVSFFFASVVLWIVVGAFWLLPQKLKLMKRVGHLTAHQIIQLGKEGDVEVQSLRKKGWWWIATGMTVLLPQLIVLNIIKTTGN